jgi:hypothetical protein
METLDSASVQAGIRVAIYDRRDVGNVHGLDWQERLAACYRRASARGHVVLDQFISRADAGDALPTVLGHALEVCAAAGASLLVYASECIGKDSSLIDAAAERLGSRPVLLVLAKPSSTEREAVEC